MMIISGLLNLLKAGKKMIGIIGGNGVAATNKLNDLIEEEYTKNGAFRDAHHPELLIWQATQAPSRSMFLEGKGICNIKNTHRFDDINSEERPNFIFKRVREHLLIKGADIVVMGCTDIRVDYYDDRDIDSLEVLKKRIINEFL